VVKTPLVNSYDYEFNTEYVAELAHIMNQNEMKLRPNPDYMNNQPHISENMRSILVDWLVDVSVHFEVMSETLHFAINFIDRTLSKITIEKNRLQLIGVACMKIADVFNEKSKEYYR